MRQPTAPVLGTPWTRSATKVALLGAGEIGKEVTIALSRLGVEVTAIDRYEGAPAQQVAHNALTVDMRDPAALTAAIRSSGATIVVPEIEALATDALAALESAGEVRVVPTARAVQLTMNREGIRRLAAEELGLATSSYAFASSLDELRAGAQRVGFPCVVKPVMSSSGHGQSVVRGPEDLVAVLQPIAPEVSTALEAVQPRGAVGLDAIDPEELESLVERIGPDVFEKAWRGSEKVRQDTMRQEIVAAATGNVIEELRDGYAVVTPVDPEHEGWGRIEVRAGATDGLPLAVRGEPWARGAVLSYDLRWIPQDQADAYAEVVSRSRRRERQTARDLVEELATVLVTAVSGVAVDDDGFLVSLGEDAAEV